MRKNRSKVLKRCSICGKGIAPRNKSGFCSGCYREEYRKRDYVKANEKIYRKEYYQTERGREKVKESNKRYYQNHKLEIIKNVKAYQERKKMEKNNEKSV